MKFLSQINVNTEYTLPIVDGVNGQVLATDGNGTAYWGSISAGATNLNALTDVVISSPSTGQLLRYGIPLGSEDPNPVWYNWSHNFLTTGSSIDALGDVTISTATAGQILQYNGTAWVNTTLSTVEYVSKVQHLVKAGVAITKGQAVYVTGSDGTNMIVGLASNTSEGTSSKVMGLAASTAAINGQIFVVTEGLLAGLNTSTATAGDPVWLGANGNLIFGLLGKPTSPLHLVYIGVVTRVQQNNGEIFVKVQNGIEIDEIHDVQISSPSTGQLLRRDTDGYWKNWNPNFLTAEADTLATVTGRGASTSTALSLGGGFNVPDNITNYISRFQTNDYTTMHFFSRAWQSVQGANGLAYNFTTHTNDGNGGYGALQIYYGESGYVYAPTSFRAPSFSSTALFITNADTSGSLQPAQGDPANKIYSFRWQGNEGGYIDTDNKITFSGFKTPTGTASQFLKANGTVDSNTYVTSTALNGYATETWVNANFYNEGEIDDFFSGAEAIGGYNKSNWDAAYNDKINSASFATSTGVLTLTQQDLGTVTVDLDGRYLQSFTETDPTVATHVKNITATNISNWNDAFNDSIRSASFNTANGVLTLTQADLGTVIVDLDGRYITSETDSQTLTWTKATSSLAISNGNSVTLEGLATEVYVDTGLDTKVPTTRTLTINGTAFDLSANRSWTISTAETDTLATVTGRGNSTTTALYLAGGSFEVPALHIRSGGNSWSEGLAIHPSTDSGYALSFYRTRAAYTDQTNTWAIGNLGDSNALNHFGLLRKGLTGGIADRPSDAIFTISPTGTFKFGFNPYVGTNLIWHAGNDGSGSGLDADLIDGIDSSSILWGNAKGTNDSVTTDADGLDKTGFYTSSAFVTRPEGTEWMYIQHIKLYNNNSLYQKQVGYDTYDDRMWVRTRNASGWTSWKEIVTSDNIGNYALTSLPAHTHTIADVTGLQTALDGKASTSHTHDDRYYTESESDGRFIRKDANDSFSGNLTSAQSGWIKFYHSNETDTNDGKIGAGVFNSGLNIVGAQTTAGTGRQVRVWGSLITDAGNSYWHAGNDGTGSGLDADLLDGNHASAFAAAAHTHTIANVTGLQTALDGKLSAESDTLDSVTSRGATTSNLITITGSEGREVAVYMPSSYTTDDLVSGHEYGWYSDHWRLGMTRSGASPGADFVVQWNGERMLSLTNGGSLTIRGTFTEQSSIRYKENVKSIPSVSQKVEQLDAVSYNKIGSNQEEIGLIAEDVAELFPEVVKYDNEGRPDGVNYSRLSVILLKAVQELTERVNKLENK